MKMPSSITARNNNHHTLPAAPTPPPQTSAISLSRLIVLLVAAAAGVLYPRNPPRQLPLPIYKPEPTTSPGQPDQRAGN